MALPAKVPGCAVVGLACPTSPSPPQIPILIVGAGPTGLGAATRLHQQGNKDWILIDQARSLASCPPPQPAL